MVVFLIKRVPTAGWYAVLLALLRYAKGLKRGGHRCRSLLEGGHNI